MSGIQAIAVAVGFVAAVFAFGLGAGAIADWLNARKQMRMLQAADALGVHGTHEPKENDHG
jgi:hypothetical protein